MSLSAPITLGEARQSVLVRVGMGIQGNQSANAYEFVDELIRSAIRQLYVEAAWTALQMETTINLSTGQSEVDWPDDSEPGSIQSVVAVHINGQQVEVGPGLRTNERNLATVAGRPVTYYYHDGAIFLLPAASADWSKLLVNYTASPNRVEEDSDTILLDSEAVIQHATLAFKRYWNLPIQPADEARFQRYLEQVRANQDDGSGFLLGGRKRAMVELTNRVGRARFRGIGNVPYTTDWNPF